MVRNKIDALKDDLRLGLTKDFLLEEYINKDRSLQDIADEFSVGVKKIRGALDRANIKKDPAQLRSKISRIVSERISQYGDNFSNFTLQERQANQIKGVKARLDNKIKKLEKDGITKNYLEHSYISENKSLKELQEQLGLTKKELRNLLNFYNITKSQESKDRARKANFDLLYKDSEKVRAMTLKRHETVSNLYGNRWYRKITSKEENSLGEAIKERYPTIKLIQSDWSTIRRSSNNAPLQLDFLLPEIKVAIEYNGEYYHDRERYEASLRGECESPELEKSKLCQDVGIELVHVWSSDWKTNPESVLSIIADMI